jgi:hypothetical protein
VAGDYVQLEAAVHCRPAAAPPVANQTQEGGLQNLRAPANWLLPVPLQPSDHQPPPPLLLLEVGARQKQKQQQQRQQQRLMCFEGWVVRVGVLGRGSAVPRAGTAQAL